jgi:hypothetical protein
MVALFQASLSLLIYFSDKQQLVLLYRQALFNAGVRTVRDRWNGTAAVLGVGLGATWLLQVSA